MGKHPGVRRRALGVGLAVALVPLLSACDVWEQLGHGAGNTRFNPKEAAITPGNVGSLTRGWSVRVNGDFSEPILSGGKLYTTVSPPTGAGRVRSYDAKTGALAWDKPVPASTNPGEPGPVVLAGGALWVSHSGSGASSCAASLSRLDPATGNVLSTETTGAAILGPVVASGTTAAFVTRGGCGQPGNQPQLRVRDTATPSAASWTSSLPTATWASPKAAIGNGKIYVAAEDVVYAFDAAGCGAATCTPLWTAALTFDGAPALAYEGRPVAGPDGTLYIGASTQLDGALVFALDGATGAPLWRTEPHSDPGSGWQSIALAHDQLYVSDHRHDGPGGALEVFTAAGCGESVCAPEWSASIDGPPVGGLTVGGDVLYVGLWKATDSRFAAFNAHGCGAAVCSRLANVAFGAEQPIQAAVAGGRVAVASVDETGTSTLRILVPAS